MRRPLLLLIGGCLLISACRQALENSAVNPVNWEKRAIQLNHSDSLLQGSSYLSVYSQIYSITEHRTHDLTATISMRNANRQDSIFISKAEYYNTSGDLIRTYFPQPIFLKPMETVEIVIEEKDKEGGTGANFLFEWSVKPGLVEPIFEGVMISTLGSQGLSFTTAGRRIQ